MEKLILIGAGGYAKSVIDSIDYFNMSWLDLLMNIQMRIDIWIYQF